jgi:D-erythronate 2-dehydrogenase
MRVLIIGGGGMIGQKLARHLGSTARLGDATLTSMALYDIAEPAPVKTDVELLCLEGNLAAPGEPERLAALGADVIFHLAAIVSGEAEADFDKGWEVNGHGIWRLLEAVRAQSTSPPRFVFTSSIAVFGAPFPEVIGDEFFCTPLTSYGAQKAVSELLVGDYSRRGFLDGISIRLPTVCVRPGKPNLAASSFFSGIIREPLNRQEAILPVEDTVRHWFASPRSAVGFLVHAATLDTGLLHERRALNMPGLSCTVAEQIDALREIAGDETVALIRRQPDERIRKIVNGWPRNFSAERASELGFRAESDFREIIRIYIEEDLGKS